MNLYLEEIQVKKKQANPKSKSKGKKLKVNKRAVKDLAADDRSIKGGQRPKGTVLSCCLASC